MKVEKFSRYVIKEVLGLGGMATVYRAYDPISDRDVALKILKQELLHEPQVLIVDEPMVGLDPKSQRLVKDLLRQEVAKGVTIFMSTHLLADAEALASRIGIVDHGRLIGLGTLADLRQQARHDGSLEDVFLTLTAEGAKEA